MRLTPEQEEKLRNFGTKPKPAAQVDPVPVPVPQPVPVEKPEEGEGPDEDDVEDALDDKDDENDSPVDSVSNESVFSQNSGSPHLMPGEGNIVPEMENEGDRIKTILEGARSTNPHYANLPPWDIVVAKLKDSDEKMIIRLGAECLVIATDMFGQYSLPVAHIWEELKTEVEISRADNGFAAQLLVTQIQQSEIKKKIQRQDRIAERGGMFGGLRKTPQVPDSEPFQ